MSAAGTVSPAPEPGCHLEDDGTAAKTRRWWRTYQWWVVAGATVVAVTLGFIGFRAYLGPDSRSSWDFLYLSLQLFVLESGNITGPAPASLEVARLLAPIISAYAIVALVATVARDELVGVRTRLRRDHVIVCGLEAGWALTCMLRGKGEHVVVIEKNAEHPQIDKCRANRIPVLVGDARDEQLLRRAGIRRARRLFVVCGDDAVNMKVGEQARRLRGERSRARPIRVLVHVEDPYLCNLLAMRELEVKGSTEEPIVIEDTSDGFRDDVRLDFFSLYAGGARALLKEYRVAGAADDPTGAPHLLVVGLGRLGRQLVVQAARNWRAQEHGDDERLWITVADHEAEAHVAWLHERHLFLDQTCDLQDAELPADPLRLLRLPAFHRPGCPPVSNVFVCMPDDAEGLATGLALQRGWNHHHIPIVVRTYNADLGALLPGGHRADAGGPYVFDQMDRTCRPDQLFLGVTETLALAIHDAYKRQREAVGDTPDTNPSIVDWVDLPQDKKDSNRSQAEDIPRKPNKVGCNIAPLTDPDAEMFEFEPADLELLSWVEHKRWQAEDAPPEHPDNVPWEDLSKEKREVDRNFIRRIPALLATTGLQIARVEDRTIPTERRGVPA